MPDEYEYERFPKRKNPRINGYDYATQNYYFITICTKNKKCIFGSPDKLNSYGEAARNGLMQINDHFPNARVDKFTVMPNHVHAIIILCGGGSSLPTIVGSYKSFVSRAVHAIDPKIVVWQTSFHDHVIRNEEGYRQIWQYIDTNSARWQEDCFCISDAGR